MPVLVRNRRKYRGLARSRIALGIDVLTRLTTYDTTHPDKELFNDEARLAVGTVQAFLAAAMAATIPVS